MGPFSIRDQSKIGAVSESRGTPLEFEPLTASLCNVQLPQPHLNQTFKNQIYFLNPHNRPSGCKGVTNAHGPTASRSPSHSLLTVAVSNQVWE